MRILRLAASFRRLFLFLPLRGRPRSAAEEGNPRGIFVFIKPRRTFAQTKKERFASLFLSAVYLAFFPAATARSFLYAEVGFLL